jgi:uncharacterized membrane protein YoaK (UPF0700 family)/anti-anti-sigma regulatory factor
MFVSQAHSFRQQARLAITLSWIGGYTNILTVLLCGQVTSHLSGSASQLGRDVVEGRWSAGGYVLALLCVFFAGAATSGALTELGRRLRWASIYVLPMAVEAALLATFALLVEWKVDGRLAGESALLWLTALPVFAMGLQNATITRISGGVVRTTHVTGVVTDLGIEGALWAIGKFDARRSPRGAGSFASGSRLLLLFSIFGGFVVGGASGTLAHELAPRISMVPAVLFLLWIVGVDLWQPIAGIRTNLDVGGDLHDALPPEVAVYHLDAKPGRLGRRARLPNLSAWAEHLDDGVRVVLLDVSEIEAFDSNAALEVRAFAQRLEARHMSLVLAGVTPKRYRKFQQAGVLDVATRFDVHVCGDIDLAAARAITLLEDVHRRRADGAA